MEVRKPVTEHLVVLKPEVSGLFHPSFQKA
jgi:hypothetical protein